MTLPGSKPEDKSSARVSELFLRFLKRQTADREWGISPTSADERVTPYDAAGTPPIDARLAWSEAQAVFALFQPQVKTADWKPPADWTTLVVHHEPVPALAFCAGNFPQLVRNLSPLVQTEKLSQLLPREERPLVLPALDTWVELASGQGSAPYNLLIAGILRLANHLDQASQWLGRIKSDGPASWQSVWANEEAALSWHQGKAEVAFASWQAQKSSTAVLFNRGMASLFTDHPSVAVPALTQAVSHLPETSAWHHLGRLYLALAEMRS
jgi:hypothetical protein